MTRTVRRVAAVTGSLTALCGLAVAGLLLRWSPGRPRPFVDATGRTLPQSVSEKTFVDVNGVRQGMFIKGKDVRNPVLLFLHGGPGMPEYFLDRTHPTGLYDDFTVCWWEQRGAGLSCSGAVPRESLTVDQLVGDAVAVTDYLRERFGQDRIYLMGHSWGSFLGIQTAARAPRKYHAYIGMGQVACQQRSELLAWEYALAQSRKLGDRKMVRALEKDPVTLAAPLPGGYMKVRDRAMHGLGIGTTHDMRSVVTGVFVPVWRTPDYSVAEKIAIGRGKAVSRGILWDDFQSTDLTAKITALEIPVYFFSGRYDYTVNHDLSRAYLARLTAPAKGFYTFEHSAHSPLFEEPARARRILVEDVLEGTTGLADGA